MKPLLLLTSLLALTLAQAQTLEPRTLMTLRGDAVLTDDLSGLGKDGWKPGKGDWQIVGGALQGAEVITDRHAATYRRNFKFQDAVIEFQFKLAGAKLATLSLNDATGHVARVLMDAKGFYARQDDHDRDGPGKAVNFNRVDVSLEPDRWYTMLIEIRGSEMLARLVTDDMLPVERMMVSYGEAKLIGNTKTNFGFTVSGTTASFRNLRLSRALENPDWAATKKQLAMLQKR
jgi:hypothetical protein